MWKIVSSFLLKLHFKSPENFLRNFYREHVCFSIYYGFCGEIVRNLAKFFKRIVKNAFYVSRGTLWRKHCWLLEVNSTFVRKVFGFAPEKLQDCCHMSTICFQMANWKNIFAKNFTFLFFFGPPGNVFWLFRWINLGMVVKTAVFMPKRTYALRKIFWQIFFYQFWTMRYIFLNFHWNIWSMVVKTTVYVFRGALWEGFRTMRESF